MAESVDCDSQWQRVLTVTTQCRKHWLWQPMAESVDCDSLWQSVLTITAGDRECWLRQPMAESVMWKRMAECVDYDSQWQKVTTDDKECWLWQPMTNSVDCDSQWQRRWSPNVDQIRTGNVPEMQSNNKNENNDNSACIYLHDKYLRIRCTVLTRPTKENKLSVGWWFRKRVR